METLCIISREEALKLQQKWYFTGLPCIHGHIDKRATINRGCFECNRLKGAANYKKDPAKVKEINDRSRAKNIEKVKITNKKWTEKNQEKTRGYKKAYKVRHREKYLQQARDYVKKRCKDPTYKLSARISKQIWEVLKNDKNYRRWESFVDYKVADLKAHLESKFTSEMSWENYGTFWEIDHIRPLSWFLAENNKNINEIWALSNLQPLECSLNRSKLNKNNFTREEIIKSKKENK